MIEILYKLIDELENYSTISLKDNVEFRLNKILLNYNYLLEKSYNELLYESDAFDVVKEIRNE